MTPPPNADSPADSPADSSSDRSAETSPGARLRARHLLVPATAVLAVPLSALLLADRVPDPVARHWTLGGRADGSADLWLLTALMTALVALTGGALLSAVRGAPTTRVARMLICVAHGLVVGLAGLHVATLAVQRDVADWREADLAWGTVALLAVLPALVAGALGRLLAADLTVDRPPAREAVEATPVEPGQAVVWVGRTSAAWTPALSTLLLLVAASVLVLGGEDAVVTVLVLVVVALLVAATGRATVSVGPAGLRVRGGLLPWWPRLSASPDEIESVCVEQVRLAGYGGLGYRVVPGARAVVTWPGEGLRVERRDGPAYVVTVPGARTAAAVLQAHLDRAGSGSTPRTGDPG